MYSSKNFKIFWEKDLDTVLQAKNRDMQAEINGKPDNYILNVNETEYINYLVND